MIDRLRQAVAIALRWLRGGIGDPPRFRRMRSAFLRALGGIYLIAFWSLGTQVDGLIGRRGILPVGEFLDWARTVHRREAYRRYPTLLWLDHSDAALHALCWGGVAVSVALIAGLLPGPCLVVLWLGYLSLTVAGQVFLGYQWDGLLLETGLLAILFAPWGLWLGRARREPSRASVLLLHWLLFRLMFESGVVKLTSGDATWAGWRALDYHYETQPLPTWTSWLLHQAPPWFHKPSLAFMFWAELVAPFLIFTPRRPRWVAFASLVLLQVMILATGNYGFFNLLSIVLCLTLIEDRDWPGAPAEPGPPAPDTLAHRILVLVAAVVIVLVTTMQGLDRMDVTVLFPEPMEVLRARLEPLRSLNAYGLFAVMTTDRVEIEVERSDDGERWEPYRFRWKPDEPGRRPRFATPHMPRLDWQMWFAALHPNCRSAPWFLMFEVRLLEGSPPVLALLRDPPPPDRRPKYLRARRFRYQFARRGSPDWWTREDLGFYCPPVRLPDAE